MSNTVTFQVNDLFEGCEIVIKYENGVLCVGTKESPYEYTIYAGQFPEIHKTNRIKAGGSRELGFGSVEVVIRPDQTLKIEGELDADIYNSIVALTKDAQ